MDLENYMNLNSRFTPKDDLGSILYDILKEKVCTYNKYIIYADYIYLYKKNDIGTGDIIKILEDNGWQLMFSAYMDMRLLFNHSESTCLSVSITKMVEEYGGKRTKLGSGRRKRKLRFDEDESKEVKEIELYLEVTCALGERFDVINGLVEVLEEKGFQKDKIEREKEDNKLVVFVTPGLNIKIFDRYITKIKFDDVKQNYITGVNNKLQFIKKYIDNDKTDFGRLCVFHGDPGTGKTYAIRSLISELSNTISVVFLKPLQCLQNLDVLIQAFEIISSEHDGAKNFLFIFEDVGEIFQKDSRTIYPEILSHILNMSDGLLGLLHNSYILMTFNTDIKDMDAALIRPGRTMSIVEFPLLDYDHAQRLIGEDNDITKRQYSLAEVYALKSKDDNIIESIKESEKNTIGFGR